MRDFIFYRIETSLNVQLPRPDKEFFSFFVPETSGRGFFLMAKAVRKSTQKLTKTRMEPICVQIADGKGLKRICEGDKDLPSYRTVLRAVLPNGSHYNAELADMYNAARHVQAELLFDEIAETARQAADDEDFKKANAYRVKIDALKWAASKLLPHRYGENRNVMAAKVGSGDNTIEVVWAGEGGG